MLAEVSVRLSVLSEVKLNEPQVKLDFKCWNKKMGETLKLVVIQNA